MKLKLKKCVVLAAISISIPTSSFAYSFPFDIPEHGYFDITPTNTTQYNISSNEDLYGINLSPNESGYHTIFLDSINTNTLSGYCNYNWVGDTPSTLCTSMFPMGLYDINSGDAVNNKQATNVFPQYLALSTTTDLFATMGREISALTLLLEQGKKYFLSLGSSFNTSGLRLFTKPDQNSKIVLNTCNWNGLYGNSTSFNCLNEIDTPGSDILAWVTDEAITSHTQIFDSSFGNGHTSNSATTTATTTCTENCFSNVMFFPGIMGSKLYEQGTFEGSQIDIQRWSSGSDLNQERLSMDSNGYSINNLYTKADTKGNTGVTDEIGISGTVLEGNIYKSFMSDLAEMKASPTIGIDYSIIPYDWRLQLSEIVSKGKAVDGNLYYGTTTTSLSDSFIIQELQHLVDTSKSGNVTIIAHSNGGLVAKELIQELKETINPLYEKIDKVIFVGVPQVGTPEAVTTMLHGSNIGPAGVYVSPERTRDLFQNMPSMYNLLPSEVYFNNLSPLIEFAPSQVQQGLAYGSDIDTYQEYIDYLKGSEGRAAPTYTDTISPQKANQTLLQSSINTHQRLDNWLPATSTKVYQVAGWGIYTPSGLKYADKRECVPTNSKYLASSSCTYTTATTVSNQLKLNGDGTVLSGSAQAMGESSQVENWWVDLLGYNKQRFTVDRVHKDVLEVDDLRNFVKNLVTNSSLPTQYISQAEPVSPIDDPYTKYEIHSPLHLTVIDNQGNITGYSTSTSQILEQIKGSQYLQSADVKTVIIPQNTPHTVIITGYDSGSFTLDINKLQGDTVIASSTFEAIPNSTSTVAILKSTNEEQIQNRILAIDFENDTTTDIILTTKEGEVTFYKPKEQESSTTTSQATPTYGGSGGAIYYSPIILQNTQNTATTTATNTMVYVESTPTKEIELSISTPPTPQPPKTLKVAKLKPKVINTPQKKVLNTTKPTKTIETKQDIATTTVTVLKDTNINPKPSESKILEMIKVVLEFVMRLIR